MSNKIDSSASADFFGPSVLLARAPHSLLTRDSSRAWRRIARRQRLIDKLDTKPGILQADTAGDRASGAAVSPHAQDPGAQPGLGVPDGGRGVYSSPCAPRSPSWFAARLAFAAAVLLASGCDTKAPEEQFEVVPLYCDDSYPADAIVAVDMHLSEDDLARFRKAARWILKWRSDREACLARMRELNCGGARFECSDYGDLVEVKP